MKTRSAYLSVLVATLVVAACSPADTTTTSTLAVTTTTAAPAATTTAPATTTSSPAITTTTVPMTTTTLRGEAVDLGPPRGAILSVVGVAHDDVLNLRAAPGADQTILDGIPPTYDAVLALGETRSLPAFWTRVEFGGQVGWVNIAYLAYAGATSDITASVLTEAGGSLEAATMTELGKAVAEIMASDDPPSDIVLVVPETVGDLGEVTYDVVGIGDDSVLGFRLHVFGTPDASGFTLKSVESTVFCQPTRGVTDDGLCI
jgi:hypothetical protein